MIGEIQVPLTNLQIALSKAVDLARDLPKGSASADYAALVGVYLTQIAAGVIEALTAGAHLDD